jgi:hypothetical protein
MKSTQTAIVLRITFLLLVAWPACAHAAYKISSGNFRREFGRLLFDLVTGKIDTENLGSDAVTSLNRMSGGTMLFPKIKALGAIKLICPTIIVRYKSGREMSARVEYDKGVVDWNLWFSDKPEKILNVFFLAGPGGPPGIMPYLKPGSEILPPTDFGCDPIMSSVASDDELKAACIRWPEMC